MFRKLTAQHHLAPYQIIQCMFQDLLQVYKSVAVQCAQDAPRTFLCIVVASAPQHFLSRSTTQQQSVQI